MKVGYSTHEEPNETRAINLAIAKGIFSSEKHVAVETEKYSRNAYSSTPDEIQHWLKNAVDSLKACGSKERLAASNKELSDLAQFKRGVFAKDNINKGDIVSRDSFYCAWPSIEGQYLADSMSKYNCFTAAEDISAHSPVLKNNASTDNQRDKAWGIVQDVKAFLDESKITYPSSADLEISHHYGIDGFYETGISMITVINREYCKKLIIVLPGQRHPEQHHKQKEETFMILHGKVNLFIDGVKSALSEGDTFTIFPPSKHSFSSEDGCVIEEVSSTHFPDDSFYTDETINKNPNRKTIISYWR